MKKLSFLLSLVLLLFGCERKHVYHTYYGDIDVDTMLALPEKDGSAYYTIKSAYLDSTITSEMQLETVLEVIFYNPSQDKYFTKWYGSDGGSSSRIYFDPYKEDK